MCKDKQNLDKSIRGDDGNTYFILQLNQKVKALE